MDENIKKRIPSYLKDFKCIGGSCEDICCGGWEIHIDKNTFEQYKNVKDSKINKYIDKNIFIRDNCKNLNIDYAQIKLKYGNKCPFLGKDKYCILQSKLGEEYLSNVCAAYPRIINKLDDYYEISLEVSCLEAARIILQREEGIDLQESEGINEIGKYAISLNINTKADEFEDTNFKYLNEIRMTCIKIIKNRKYELSERLFMIGNFLESARKELCYNYNNVTEFIKKYNIDYFKPEFKRDNTNYLLQISFYKDILEMLNVFEDCKSKYFKSKMKKTIIGFKFNENKSLIENSELYLNAYDICEKEIIKEYDYIFENYLVNHMFKELFPFSENDVMLNDYIMMLVRFSYMRFFLVGQYLYDGEISKENIVRSIQALSKEIEHHKTYLKDIKRYIIKNELDNPRFAQILL